MATKQQAYDHPAYEIPIVFNAGAMSSSVATSQKFVAFTSMLLKSMTVVVNRMGTSGDSVGTNCNITGVVIKGGTGTASYTLNTFGSSGGGVGLGTCTGTNTTWTSTAITLAMGDQVYFIQGTDAQLLSVASAELYIIPGSNLTV